MSILTHMGTATFPSPLRGSLLQAVICNVQCWNAVLDRWPSWCSLPAVMLVAYNVSTFVMFPVHEYRSVSLLSRIILCILCVFGLLHNTRSQYTPASSCSVVPLSSRSVQKTRRTTNRSQTSVLLVCTRNQATVCITVGS